jgi:L-rhamnonate dehydratase
MQSSRRSFLLQAAGAVAAVGADRKMKIVSVKAVPLPLLPTSRFGTPKFTSDFDPARRRWFGPFSQLSGSILVKIETDEGITGYGLGGGGGAACYIIEHHLRDLLMGTNPLNVELLWDQMFASTSFYGRRGVVIMAMSGIDLALWDIAGKQAGQPVFQLLGGAAKEKVPAYYTGPNVERGLKLGFRAFKLPIQYGVAEGKEGMDGNLEQLREARKAIGPDALLMIDCLARWDVPYTLEMAERAADVRLYWIEEPLYPDDLTGYERLCREVRGPKIACGEHEYTRYGFQELIRHKAAQILQPDLTWSGGLTEARKVVAMGAEHGLPVIPHRGGSLYGLHLIVASANCPMAESFGTGEPGNELMATMTARFEHGYYYPPDKPGFGVELSDALLRKHVPDL